MSYAEIIPVTLSKDIDFNDLLSRYNAMLLGNQIYGCQQAAQQSINLNNFSYGLQQAKPEMIAKLACGMQNRCMAEPEKVDPDYKEALGELNEEFPGLRW